ncbi:MAG: hypothetical protein ABIF19_17110 [Planctomycetota bacterium]|uniref:Depolymerase 2 capsule K5-specific C-terminal domain-containing protein n=1 Tax=viral metagenome TaxID=1070528 RepID=A0A6M3L960_9ZZZZ
MKNKLTALCVTFVICAGVFVGSIMPIYPFSQAPVSAQNYARQAMKWLRVTNEFRVSGIAAFTPTTEVLATTFTIPATTASALWLSSATTVTSDTTDAIADGRLDGQILLLKNINASDSIVIKNSANTDLGSGDVTLGATDQIMLVWDGTLWSKLFVADN